MEIVCPQKVYNRHIHTNKHFGWAWKDGNWFYIFGFLVGSSLPVIMSSTVPCFQLGKTLQLHKLNNYHVALTNKASISLNESAILNNKICIKPIYPFHKINSHSRIISWYHPFNSRKLSCLSRFTLNQNILDGYVLICFDIMPKLLTFTKNFDLTILVILGRY